MRKDQKNPLKFNKKIASALAMLLVSATMLGTSTYAWFTMNKEVTVTGMSMKTTVGSNLLVCADNVEANYTDDLVQTRKALLEPVSTINATDDSFLYTLNAAADGHWMGATGSIFEYSEAATGNPQTNTNTTTTALGKTGYDAQFNTKYGVTPAASDFGTAYGYVDYVFFLKATSEAEDSPIRLTECNLIYNDAEIGNGDEAWRVAIFASDITSSNPGDGVVNQDITSADTDLISILKLGSTGNWTANNALSDDAGTKATVTNANQAVTFGAIDAGDTAYYKVVARVWLEGEDKTCNSETYAALMDGTWELGLQFELNQGSAVSSIVTADDNDTADIMIEP